jgi:hypothetical protein
MEGNSFSTTACRYPEIAESSSERNPAGSAVEPLTIRASAVASSMTLSCASVELDWMLAITSASRKK